MTTWELFKVLKENNIAMVLEIPCNDPTAPIEIELRKGDKVRTRYIDQKACDMSNIDFLELGITWCTNRLVDIPENPTTEVQRLREVIRLAECQYMGCGGNLRPEEIVNNMREILRKAL